MIRQAKQGDNWRAINRGNSSCFISQVECVVEGHGASTIDFGKGITAFIGRNGSRKTTLIRGIYKLLPSTKRNREIKSERSNALAVADATFIDSDNNARKLSAGQVSVEALLFDPCSSVPELRSILRQDENMEDLFEIGELRDFTDDELNELEFLSGNTYQKVELVVIEEYNKDFPRFPLYRVERNGVCYDSRDMGYGELSILLFHWIMGQIRECREDGESVVVFLEEPESFISPEYQKRLMSFCADVVATCKCQALVVSHSEHIIGRISHSKIQNIRWHAGNIEVSALSRTSEVFEELGLLPSRKALLVCEDQHSKVLIRELLRCSSRFGVNEFLIHVVNGDGDVKLSLTKIPKIIEGFRFIGVLDGDCRNHDWSGFNVCSCVGRRGE